MSGWIGADVAFRLIEEGSEAEWDRYRPRPATSTYRMRRSTNADMRMHAGALVAAPADRLSRGDRVAYASGTWLGETREEEAAS